MNRAFSAACRTAALFIALSVLTAGAFQLSAQEAKKSTEPQQLARIPNKIKPAGSTLLMDLPFTLDDPFTSEEIPEDMKNWIAANRKCQADREGLTVLTTYVQFSQDYMRAYVTGNEDEAMRNYLNGSMVERMKGLEESGQISSFSHRIMEIKLSGSKDKALLLKGRYREKPQNFEVWVLQILHKKEIWQVLFFFDPKDLVMQDAVEAACFSAVIK